MKELRKHFEIARAEHEQMRYPGSLARDVFAAPVIEYASRDTARRSSLFKIFAGSSVLAAIAATIVLVVWLHHPQQGVKQNYVYVLPPAEEQTPFVLNTVPQMPTDLQIAPHDIGSLAPTYQSISVSSVPSFWNLDSDSSDSSHSSSTSKEPA